MTKIRKTNIMNETIAEPIKTVHIEGIYLTGVSSIKSTISEFEKVFKVGSLISFAESEDITWRCVNVDGKRYTFCSEEILGKSPHFNLPIALQNIWNKYIPSGIQKEINHLFIASYRSVVGKEGAYRYEKDGEINQYQWFKNNEAHKCKNFKEETSWWWLSSAQIDGDNNVDSIKFTYINFGGSAGADDASYVLGVVPFFEVTLN